MKKVFFVFFIVISARAMEGYPVEHEHYNPPPVYVTGNADHSDASLIAKEQTKKGDTYITVGCCNNFSCGGDCYNLAIPNFCANIGNLWREAIGYLGATTDNNNKPTAPNDDKSE